MDKRTSLIVMVVGMMIAYIAYLRIIKRKEAERENARSQDARDVQETPPPPVQGPVAAEAAAKPAQAGTKLPGLLLVFATMLGLYTAYILLESTLLAIAGLQGDQSSIAGVLVMLIPATLRLVTLTLLFRRNKAFRWSYVLTVLLGLGSIAYSIYMGAAVWNMGYAIIALFYAAWIAYLFRSQFIANNFSYGKRKNDAAH